VTLAVIYVALIALGARTVPLIVRHVLPNALAPLIVQATYVCASAIVIEGRALFLAATVLAVNIMGDGLRDSLDPRLRKRL
jgi:peptide/nickel transport system permease protein